MTEVLLPVGRLVQGSLTKPQTKNQKGELLATPRYFFAVAIPKGAEAHWKDATFIGANGVPQAWGATIWNEGVKGHGALAQSPTFSWKIEDGNSPIPKKNGAKPNAEREGHPGAWIVKLSSGFAPKTVNASGTTPVDPEGVKCGHYVQVLLEVEKNSGETPGVYLNHRAVAHSGFGPEIAQASEVDTSTVGFGGALPPGASATPVAAMASAPPAATASAPPPPTTVQPDATFVEPPPPPGNRLNGPKAQAGVTYEAMVAKGWTDDLLRQHGHML